jgi:fused signal recognition particle receptor
MFKFLKEKLNSVVKKFSKDVEEESEIVEVKETQVEIKPEEKKETKKVETKQEVKSEKKEQDTKEKKKEQVEKKQEEKLEEKKEIAAEKEFSKKQSVQKEKIVVANQKVEKKKEIEKEKLKKETKAEIKEEKKEHKKGLFSRIFKSKEKHEDEDEEKLEEIIEEKQKSKEELIISKEDLQDSEIEEAEFETLKKSEDVFDKNAFDSSDLKEYEEAVIEKREEIKQNIEEEKAEEKPEPRRSDASSIADKSERKGFFSKITETFTKINLSEDKFEELFWELEVMLLENNVAVEVIQKIKDDLKAELMSDKISRKNVDEIIRDSLKKSLEEILDIKGFNIEDRIKNKKPYVIAVIGVNGSGKTTTIAKLCYLLKKKGFSVVLAAADTFRAAAIQQLEHHAEKLDVKMIKHDYNSDPAAVAFDAIKHAEAKKIDVVVIDTAGRLHSNDNLMNELKKLIKVNKPDLKLFVGESITGNDCVEQAKVYDEIIGIDAIILSKADVDEKGGAALSISYVTKKPVLFIGTGQTYDDLKQFNRKEIMEGLGF